FYAGLLHRAADRAGQAFWTNALLSGMSEEAVVRAFTTSAEYQAAHTSNAAYVDALYADLLNRAADPAGRAFWTNALASGTSRAAVAQSFLLSLDSVQR